MKKAEFLITELYKSFGNLDLNSSAVRHQTMIAVNNKLFNLSNEQFDEIMKKYKIKFTQQMIKFMELTFIILSTYFFVI